MDDEAPYAVFLGAVKNAPLKMSFLLHFFLASWGLMGYWSRDAYFFYNLLFFLSLFWTMHSKESPDAPLICLSINITSIFLDLMMLCIYFPSHGAADRLSAGLAILNMIARPLSSLAVYQVWQERKLFGAGQPGEGRGYDDIPGTSYGATYPEPR